MHIGDVPTFAGVEDASLLMLRCRRRNEERGRY